MPSSQERSKVGLHNKQSQKQGERDQNHIGRRRVGCQGAAGNGKHNDNTSKGSHHYQDGRSQRQNGYHHDNTENSGRRRAVCSVFHIEADALRRSRAGRADKGNGDEDKYRGKAF